MNTTESNMAGYQYDAYSIVLQGILLIRQFQPSCDDAVSGLPGVPVNVAVSSDESPLPPQRSR